MVEGEPEVQQDGADDGVNEGAVVGAPIRELHHLVQAVGQLFLRRWVVEHLVVGVADLDAIVLRPLQTLGRGRIAQGVRRHRHVQSQNGIGGQRRVLHGADRLHGPVVVQDHPLAEVSGAPPGADHPRRGGLNRQVNDLSAEGVSARSAARRMDLSAHTQHYGPGAARPDPRAVVRMYELLQIKMPR